jgi:hypothetical protein
MKKLLLIALTLCLTLFVWTLKHAKYRSVTIETRTLAAKLRDLEARGRQTGATGQTATDSPGDAGPEIGDRKGSADPPPATAYRAAPTPEPDASRQGGWPADAAFLYLPKRYLTNAQYKLLENGRLTDQAATLLGMSAAERAKVDQLFSDLFAQFRRLEYSNMKAITPPEGWQGALFGAKLESAVAYQIPGLSAEVEAARQQFAQQVQQTLGASRSQLLEPGMDSHLRQQMDDLGAGDRVIGFLTATEKDGSQTIWYGIADARHGEGSFQRVPSDVAADSQMAYYANLFGVKLPGNDQQGK